MQLKGLVIVIGNILVAHGMRKGEQNRALEEFITTLLKMKTTIMSWPF